VRTCARIAQVHHLSKNGGKAEAVRKGMLHVLNRHNLTNADVIAFWDADLVRGREREGEGVGVRMQLRECAAHDHRIHLGKTREGGLKKACNYARTLFSLAKKSAGLCLV
jgi:hypothetical protein